MADQPHADVPAPVARTVSVVRLQADQWIATSTADPTIRHHAESLTDVLAAHRHAVSFKTGTDVVVRYELGDDDTVERIARIRAAGERVAALRREASHTEAAIRAERTALMRELANLLVTPREIAQIVGVPTTAVPKDLGTDRDARLARSLATHALPPDDPAAAERLF
jgi:hypothetical protein